MADEKKPEDTLYCATPGCDVSAVRGTVLKSCLKCGGRSFVGDARKKDIDSAASSESVPEKTRRNPFSSDAA